MTTAVSVLDLRSDTVTRPTPAMRRAMAEAEVGDDQLDGDPTMRRLEARVAAMLGKEQGLFLPSGTMANQAAIRVHTTPGTEILLDANAHIVHHEMAGAAAISGVQLRPVVAAEGRVAAAAADVERTLRPVAFHAPPASLVCVENTHNGAGGRAAPLAELQAIRDVADANGLPVHLDGARLWNASVATGTALADFARTAHTVMLSLTKGLGCPAGAVLVGDERTIRRAREVRNRLGGGMHQSGILAAAALHALDAHLPRLAIDHANATIFADLVDGAAGTRVVPPDTNIVMLDLPDGLSSPSVVDAARSEGVLLIPWNLSRIRAVTHLDVDAAAASAAGRLVRAIIERLAGRARDTRPAHAW